MDNKIKKFVVLHKALIEERASIQERLEQINKALSGTPATTPTTKIRSHRKGRRGKRKMSSEARARIAEAQKKRWGKVKSRKAAKR